MVASVESFIASTIWTNLGEPVLPIVVARLSPSGCASLCQRAHADGPVSEAGVMQRVLQLNALASAGGASRAALRLHQALLDEGRDLGWTSYFRAISGSVSGEAICVASAYGSSTIRRRLHPPTN